MLILGIIALVIIGIVLYFNNKSGQNQSASESTTTTEKQSASNFKTACDIYTQEIASKYLGASAKKGDTTNSDNSTEGDDTIVSSCLYEDDAEISKIVNIQLIAAKNDAGKDWNKTEFKNSPKETAEFAEETPPVLENIEGVGDSAYWNPQMGQLCVLVSDGQYWLTVQGSVNSTAEEKAQFKQMAIDLVAQI
jgi:hypothetical protein